MKKHNQHPCADCHHNTRCPMARCSEAFLRVLQNAFEVSEGCPLPREIRADLDSQAGPALRLLNVHCYARGCWIHYTDGREEYSHKYTAEQTAGILQHLGLIRRVHPTRAGLYVTAEVESYSVGADGKMETNKQPTRLSWGQYCNLYPLNNADALKICAHHQEQKKAA